jgi:hypothetical protein
MNSITLHTREARTVQRERGARRITTFERQHGVRINRPGRRQARHAAITASVAGSL